MNVHVGLNVTNVEESIRFYSILFGEEPVKVKEDYAKFLIKDLHLNFTLNAKDSVSGNQVGHFGIQVDAPEDIEQQKDRIKQAKLALFSEENTVCCYARQDKFWITDPDGNEWEFFYTWEDVEQSNESITGECCL
ncbi:ArsI/CadI family heavy metal resistance metalloenzyme [Alkalihalobacterium bogoriense]|uniref:ArsI/CadI family heavy metal resistance metalloenzyme n=1 Tax=Alkalihalobacterium bogoriense TaxID=246272 RepID=UPI0005566D20|nr:ArsI/CadI family heavy metal resistance metalloenzyme [Alkalihalobacterium bogoriense]